MEEKGREKKEDTSWKSSVKGNKSTIISVLKSNLAVFSVARRKAREKSLINKFEKRINDNVTKVSCGFPE